MYLGRFFPKRNEENDGNILQIRNEILSHFKRKGFKIKKCLISGKEINYADHW